MYKVIKFFNDLKDNKHAYKPGDVYPREGAETSPERVKELSGSDNRRGEPLIELVKEEPKAPAKKPAKKTAEK